VRQPFSGAADQEVELDQQLDLFAISGIGEAAVWEVVIPSLDQVFEKVSEIVDHAVPPQRFGGAQP
jgi:hypothetical protein